MPHIKQGALHHCPALKARVFGYPGKCRKGTDGFCVTHSKTCPKHPYWFYTMNLLCIICQVEEAQAMKEEKKRRKTYDGEEEESEEEYTTEVKKVIVNGKFRKMPVRTPIGKNKPSASMIKKNKGKNRQKRINLLAGIFPDLNIPENPLAGDAEVKLPLPTFDKWRALATKLVDNSAWNTLRAALIDEGVSEEKLPAMSPTDDSGRTISALF
ncbi:hypothetical protein L207DRAFT_530153 [Hyaloscypha variabilis F]|uniref:Uncharacterized protein n=1 Tax=Hyaloscypha variabilis (strain UAMH 11265 / GT02V1 / F) TaxID=1149755 RepID=A0A2J6RJI2_HYAVF|nr:hypothetical protein L207DRAFT_530153 [Hyaloscypha variabilis F]